MDEIKPKYYRSGKSIYFRRFAAGEKMIKDKRESHIFQTRATCQPSIGSVTTSSSLVYDRIVARLTVFKSIYYVSFHWLNNDSDFPRCLGKLQTVRYDTYAWSSITRNSRLSPRSRNQTSPASCSLDHLKHSTSGYVRDKGPHAHIWAGIPRLFSKEPWAKRNIKFHSWNKPY